MANLANGANEHQPQIFQQQQEFGALFLVVVQSWQEELVLIFAQLGESWSETGANPEKVELKTR
jgi:hypothetical protein